MAIKFSTGGSSLVYYSVDLEVEILAHLHCFSRHIAAEKMLERISKTNGIFYALSFACYHCRASAVIVPCLLLHSASTLDTVCCSVLSYIPADTAKLAGSDAGRTAT